MDCKIVKNTDGKINDVLNQTGQSSSLFKQILNTPTLSLDEAIDLYKNIYSSKLKDKVQFQIIGEKGAQNLDQIYEATFRMDNLKVAREMEAAGKTPKEIKLATSWEKGSDSKWRYEVGDLTFKNPNQEIEIGKEYNSKDLLSGEAVDAYPNVKIKFNTNGTNLYNGVENIIELDARGVVSSSSEGGLELMEKKRQEPRPLLHRLSTVDTRSLEHEYVHFIQWSEGFSRGGSPLAIRTRAFELSGIEDSDSGDVRIKKIKTALENITNNSDKKILQAVIDEATGVDFNAVNKAYGNLAGEIEARSVEERIGMSDFFRKRSLVLNELNIAEDDKVFLTNNLGVSKQIIGKKGAQNLDQTEEATYRTDNLLVAVEMEKVGKTPKEIRLATGWEKGVDGLFRYEILDGDIKPLTNIKSNLNVEGLGEVFVTTVENVYNNEELFIAYPNLKQTEVVLMLSDNPAFKDYRMFLANDRIYVNLKFYGNTTSLDRNTRNDFIHELQHFSQQVEGFERGGNLDGYRTRAIEYLNKVRESGYTEASKTVGFREIAKEFDNFLEKAEYIIFKDVDIIASNDESIDAMAFLYGIDRYEKLAGEVESRNVEKRMNMSAEERRQTLLEETEDVAREDQIFLMDNLGSSQMSFTPQKGQITQEIVDKLKENGLSEDVFLLSTEEINAKLKELGVSEDVRKQVIEYKNGYYSNVNVALTNLKDKNPKNVKGWISQLTDTQKNGGIKNVNQELEWIGLEDYLNDYVKENNPKAGNIPSSVVEDYIKSNQIEIVDVTSPIDKSIGKGDFMTYRLKGGERYREVLLTMTNKGKFKGKVIEEDGYFYALNSNGIKNGFTRSKTENQAREKKFILDNRGTNKDEYKSSHWSEKNILAHVRLNEKTLPDGRRVLILNEIQADISQDLKKEQDKILDRVDKEFDNFLDNLIMNKLIIEEC